MKPRTWILLVAFAAGWALSGGACHGSDSREQVGTSLAAERDPDRAAERAGMVETVLGHDAIRITDPRVIRALRTVPRHRFVPTDQAPFAYEDRPLPIGLEQTISQPYIVALMTQLAAVDSGDVVLEVGTGSGYQAAILAEMGARVFTIEILDTLATRATGLLKELGYTERIHVRAGDGYVGWPEAAPFDAILVTAAPDAVPQPLQDQLGPGGRMVIPVDTGGATQQLLVVTKDEAGRIETEKTLPVLFVPLVREKD